MEALNSWLGHWQYIWFFLILSVELVVSTITMYWVIKEYAYDENKDLEKKQRKTKTTKKTTRGVTGEEIVEETTETSEPMAEHSVEGKTSGGKREREDTSGEKKTGE